MWRSFASHIQRALDLIAPRTDRVIRLEEYTLEHIPLSLESHTMCGAEITTLTRYRDRAIEDLIRAIKYDASEKAARLLSSMLAEFLHEEIASIRLFSAHPIILIPLPLHASRRRERGFNQVEEILRHLPEPFHSGALSRIDTDSLVRSRATLQQTRLSRAERLTNVRGAFTRVRDLSQSHIILIDDVATTGATLAAARETLDTEACTLIAIAHA